MSEAITINIEKVEKTVSDILRDELVGVVRKSIDYKSIEDGIKKRCDGGFFEEPEIMRVIINGCTWMLEEHVKEILRDSDFKQMSRDIVKEIMNEEDFKTSYKEAMKKSILNKISG